ncbi:uncharacterized protein [Diabrotica undecimpunctata]|uniref:uncharacterized protein n=1 Tax=Diabrotica undecimpunctata TaxID=50387 RepID=UPI003B63976F
MDYAFGSWNVRTLNRPGAQTALLQELKRYNLMITALQETRWLGKGVRDTKTHTILYSGKEQGIKECGVAFVVDNVFKSKIIDFQAVNERICKLRIRTHFFNLTMINIYCPTDEQEQHTKESFYQQLEIVYDNAPKNDIKVIMGDMNAKIGKEPQFYGTTGKHSLHNETSENGEDSTHGEMNEPTRAEIELRIENANSIHTQYQETQLKIESLLDAITEEEINYRETFETSFYSVIIKAKQLLTTTSASASSTSSPTSEHFASNHTYTTSNIKLPSIELPKFSGNIEEWLDFHDLFDSACITGSAERVIASIPLSASNFTVTWNLLVERYSNKELLLHNHIKAIFNLKAINKEGSFSIRSLIDKFCSNLRALEALKQPVEHWDALLKYILLEKLDSESVKEWEKANNGKVSPVSDLIYFLKTKADTLERYSLNKPNIQGTSVNNHVKFRHNSTKALVSTKSSFLSCPLCNQQHKLVHCSQFHSLDIPARINKVRRFKLCLNCLHSGHQQATCKYGECKKCNQKHHTLLHEFIENPLNPLPQFNDQVVASQSSPQTLSNTSQNQQILLSTVVVQVRDHLGVAHNCRALLDSGAQSNFITSSLVDLLGISREQVNISVVGIAHVSSKINHKCNIVINSLQSIYSFPLECLIIPQICGQLPVCQIDASSLPIPANIRLSDPNFHTPSEVNILISASIFWDLLCVGQVKLGPEKPILQKTRLGWIISGPLINTRVNSQQSTIFGLSHNIETDDLSRFWEIEECSGTKLQSPEELLCEEHFKSTFRRNLDGRFIVSIPFKSQVDSLGESRSIAQRRFYSLEKRLLNDPIMKEQYVAFMEEYLSLGHMSRVTDCTLPVHSYYFPHHGVMKQDSLTTKLRVVFDGSCPSSSGHSLNDLQMVGPVMQNDLISILLRFRRYPFVASADIAKMYRQILIDDTQRCLQRILWRNHPKDPLHSYELNTVTYGSTSSSYLATRCLYQLSLEHSDTFPQASKIIAEDFYVDDLLTGSDSLEDLILNCKQVSEILSKGCFPLRKWMSNNSSFLKSIQESISLDTPFLFGANENTKTLGLQWCPSLDSLSYSIDSNVTPKIITKRSILSGIAQIFDPLGLLSPSIIKVKILMQLLWLEKLDWDEGVPLHIQSEWLSFRDQLHELNKLQIQRNVVLPNSVLIEMHGFCDASEVAYGAAIYIRSVDKKGNIFINLLCAKSKVAPVKKLSIPRLELSGALILSRLSKMVITSLNIQFNKIFLWSDSTITLGWIKTSSHVLKTFVGNRVSEIQSNTDPENWRHVPTDCNPADLLSRGIEPQVLSSCSFWWHGPSFLLDSPETWPVQVSFDKEKLPEFKTISNQFMIVSSTPLFDFEKYSSFSTLVRSVAYSLRFYYNSQRKNKATRVLGHLTTQEINNSTLTLVKLVQAEGFPSEIQCLRRGNAVSSKSRILSLNPFLDPEGLLRVGGRLRNSNFSYQKKHPILIQSNHKFTILFFRQEHFKLCHAGPQHLLAHVREKYWP